MDRNFLVIALLLAFSNFYGQALSCSIYSDKSVYLTKDLKARKYPKITIDLKNNSDSTIYIVTGKDGSNQAKRYPYAYFNIHFLGDTSRRDNSGGCGNYSNIDTNDFILLRPGQTVSPEFFDHMLYDQKTFSRKGKYKISFFYSTNESNFKKWMGDPFMGQQNKWFDRQTGKILPEYKEQYETLLALFNKVPKTEVTSWKNGEFFDVAVYEDFGKDPKDPKWYLQAFQDFKDADSSLQYAATYFIPDNLLKNIS